MNLLTLALLAVTAAMGLALVEAVIRRSEVGAVLILGLLLVDEASLFNDLTLLANPVRVGPEDALFVVLLTAAIARLLRLERLTPPQRLLVVFGLLVAWALIRGSGAFGIATATNEARKFLRFFAGALYFSTVVPERELMRRIGRIWLVVAVALAALSLVRWTANGVGLTGGFFGDGSSLRVMGAAEALIIAQGALIALPLLRERTHGPIRYLAPVLLVSVVLLQHRTVWIVAAAGTVYLLFRERALTPRVIAGLGAGLVVFAVLTFTVFDDDDVAVSDQLARSSQSTGTFEWRVEGWRLLLSDSGPESLSETAVGQPFGRGWERRMSNGGLVTASPHNFYVESYLRVGAIGLAALLLLYAIALRGSGLGRPGRTTEPVGTLSHNVLQTVIGVQLLYYITYSPDLAQAMLLGLGCAAAANHLTRDPSSLTVKSA